MPTPGHIRVGTHGLAFSMIHSVQAHDGEAGPLGVLARQMDETLSILAVAATVPEKKEGRRITGVVQRCRHSVSLDPLFSHIGDTT